MDKIPLSLPQALEAAKPLAVVSGNSSSEEAKQRSLVLTTDQLTNLSKAILLDSHLEEYAFHQKVLMDAELFLAKKLRRKNFSLGINLYPRDAKKAYLENPTKEEPYSRIWLDLSFAWHQKKVPKRVLEKLVDDLNNEFNLKRRFGLFLLEESSKGYSIYFNPNELSQSKYDYLNSNRYLSRAMCSETFNSFNRLNEDQLFVLHMENSLLETVFAKDPNIVFDPCFEIIRYGSSKGLQTWIYDPSIKAALIKEVDNWNSEYNVEKRAGVFRFNSSGPYLTLWFQPSIGNKGYQDLKKELLTDKAIAQLENRFDIIFDNRSE